MNNLVADMAAEDLARLTDESVKRVEELVDGLVDAIPWACVQTRRNTQLWRKIPIDPALKVRDTAGAKKGRNIYW